jgi:GntR family transcriptional repressor for pyruvate dehydrogenase complex
MMKNTAPRGAVGCTINAAQEAILEILVETGLDDIGLVRYHTTSMTRVHLTRVQRAGVKNQVFEQLRDRIMDRTWPPGAKIPSENALGVALGVSRVSIREALQMLASLGLLETRQGGGTYVREHSGEIFLNPLLPMLALDTLDILHVLEYRKIVEKGIVSLVVKRAGNAEIEELEYAFRAMEGHRNDARAFAQADLSFHLALAKATGNPVVMKVNAVITDILRVSMYGIVGSLGTRDGLYYHRRILDAIKARDGPRAESLMEEHVERTIRRLKRKHGGDRKSCAERKTDGKA